jgi:hypothetical protein
MIVHKERYKTDFKRALDAFAEKLRQYVTTETGEWSVKGFIDVYKNIYTISSDTKIVSKILEIHIFPQIIQFAKQIGYNIILAEQQNYYPDLTFVNKQNENIKFAVDLKTTYRKKNGIASFTLGSPEHILKNAINKRIFNSLTINIQVIFALELFIQELMTMFPKQKFIVLKNYRKNTKP